MTNIEKIREAGQSSDEWISVKDRLPEQHQVVIYYVVQTGADVGEYRGENGRNVFEGRRGFMVDQVTHWIPLPVPLHISQSKEPK